MPSTPVRRSAFVLAAALAGAVAAVASAQPVTLDLVKVGAPGNRATLPHEVVNRPDLRIGAVGYEYWIGRTEITVAQWLPFVNAYAPYWQGSPDDPQFTSWYTWRENGRYVADPGVMQWPVNVGWRVAAIYCNWLHNEQRGDRAAFERGAYDIALFTTNQWGQPVEQATRSPGARYWIPSYDEWIKAAYYDPNRYGPGQEGYWRNPARGDRQMISGLPSLGGETSAGRVMPGDPWRLPVGSYAGVESPWGLMDVSGGEWEWSEALDLASRRVLGSRTRGDLEDYVDERWSTGPTEWATSGLRVASSVPTAWTLGPMVVMVALSRRRRRCS
jgi:hypothetical protein